MSPEELRAKAAHRYWHHPMFHALVELTVQLSTHEGSQLSPEERDRAVMVASVALVVSSQTPASLGLAPAVPWART